MALEDSKYLTKSNVYKKYKKWMAGVEALESRIQKLKDEKEAILQKINDDIEETPAELVELHTKLFNIDNEIKSVNDLMAQYKERIPFTAGEILEEYNEARKALGKTMDEYEAKVKKAYENLKNTLIEYRKIYNDYLTESDMEQSRWRKVAEDVGLGKESSLWVLRSGYSADRGDISRSHCTINL